MARIVRAVIGFLLLVSAPRVVAQPYDINWHTVDGGGGQGSTGGTFDVAGTAGQPDASYALTGGSYDLAGGFWAILGVPGGGPQADLSITKTDGVTTAVPGTPVTYTVTAGNAGPDPISGGTVTDGLPAALTGATWTCVGSGGGTCTASGSGSINDTVGLPVNGTVTYTLTATVDPAATGSLSNTAAVTGSLGSVDPNPGNNSATDTDTLTPEADLSAAKDDGLTTVTAGDPLVYAITITNSGPSNVVGATVTDIVPAAFTGAVWTCKATGGTCTASGAGNIVDTVDLQVGGAATYALTGTVDVAATGSLVNTVTVAAPAGTTDPVPANDSATDTDTILAPSVIDGELNHGYIRVQDLAAQGAVADVDLFRILQQAHSSYEVLVDGISGDISSGSGPLLELLAFDQTTVLQTSVAAGAGGSRSLRVMNSLDVPVPDQYVRVQSAGCTTTCDAQDVYRLSAFDTTALVPRFNNSGTQITILLLQNTGAAPIDVDVQFWAADGTSLGGPGTQTIVPHASFVLNTSSVVPGNGGSITVANTGARGQLAGKAVALEPATGFTFDTELTPRPR